VSLELPTWICADTWQRAAESAAGIAEGEGELARGAGRRGTKCPPVYEATRRPLVDPGIGDRGRQ
jgi:hypothetical protein